MPKILTPAALQAFMDRHKLSEADVAKIIGLAPSKSKDAPNHHRTVYNWLNGKTPPAMGWACVDMYIQKYLQKKKK